VVLVLTAVVAAVSAPARSGPATATGENTSESPDTAGFVGFFSSLALDASGYPVVSYHDMTNGNLKVLHCNDPNCSGDDESIAAPDSTGSVGGFTSLALDFSGHPVISYYDAANGDLKVLHCNDAGCSGGDESITSPDTAAWVGQHTSLALDAGGHPVVSYWDVANADLKVLHCNDPNCAGGDESIASPDTEGTVGCFSSLALDANGYPVVSYRDGANDDLKVLHCNDVNCAGGEESITSPDTAAWVGPYSSLALDASGRPVVSYYDSGNGDLKVLHCNDSNCSGGDESIVSPDTGGDVGMFTSLAIDTDGYPVVSYYDATNEDLKLLHCGDPDCVSSNTLTSPHTSGSVGRETSLALDAGGSPVVSYRDAANFDLWVLHCGDPTCTKGAALPSPTLTATSLPLTPTPTPAPIPGGDVNCDGAANSVDAALILQFGAALVVSLPCQHAADVSEDGVINSIDAALILQLEAGLIPDLSP
jgi:hypothetical protein